MAWEDSISQVTNMTFCCQTPTKFFVTGGAIWDWWSYISWTFNLLAVDYTTIEHHSYLWSKATTFLKLQRAYSRLDDATVCYGRRSQSREVHDTGMCLPRQSRRYSRAEGRYFYVLNFFCGIGDSRLPVGPTHYHTSISTCAVWVPLLNCSGCRCESGNSAESEMSSRNSHCAPPSVFRNWGP